MRMIFIIIAILSLCNLAQANLYVCIDRETGDVKGTVDIQPDNIGDWAKKFIMKEADEGFRGKQGYEIKFENKKLRLATQKEIEEYFKEQEKKRQESEKQKIMESLGITEEQLNKLKVQ